MREDEIERLFKDMNHSIFLGNYVKAEVLLARISKFYFRLTPEQLENFEEAENRIENDSRRTSD